MTTRRGRLAALFCGIALALAGCSSDAHDDVLKGAPAPGKAGVWLTVPKGSDPADDALSGMTIAAAAAGPDGSVYAVAGCGAGARIDKARAIHEFGPLGPGKCVATSGIVAMPDGSVLFTDDSTLKKIDGAGRTTVVAGVPSLVGRAPGQGAQQPAKADASTFAFSAHMAPIGVRPDGSVILMDDDVVWALKDGSLTQLYVYSGPSTPASGPHPSRGAVTPAGSIYLVYGLHQVLQQGDLLRIAADGTVQPVRWDSSAPQGFFPLSVTGDGADGIYLDGSTAQSQALLHLSAGHISTLLTGHADADAVCPATMDAGSIPCRLPAYVVSLPGMALLIGGRHYALAVAVAAP